jgi:hypothetical protein
MRPIDKLPPRREESLIRDATLLGLYQSQLLRAEWQERAALEALTRAQKRCTELVEENRRLRGELCGKLS